MAKRLSVSKNEMKHISRGIFQYEGRKPTFYIKGGHGNDSIEYMERHHFPFKVEDPLPNGVRMGWIDKHINKDGTIAKNGHAWFPKFWSNWKIKKAGEKVANGKANRECLDHTPMRGEIDGVKVVAYKGRGRICGVCPDFGNKKKK